MAFAPFTVMMMQHVDTAWIARRSSEGRQGGTQSFIGNGILAAAALYPNAGMGELSYPGWDKSSSNYGMSVWK